MHTLFTEDWFYAIFSQQDTGIDFEDREIEVRSPCESTPELRQFLDTDEEVLEVQLCIETPAFSPCVLFMQASEDSNDFDDDDSRTALAAFRRVIMERHNMGLVAYWQQEVSKKEPIYRPLTKEEQQRAEQYILTRHSGSPICRSEQSAVKTIEHLIHTLALTLDGQEVFDASLSDFLGCLSELRREIVQNGLPTITDADMYYEITVDRKEVAVKLCHVSPIDGLERALGLVGNKNPILVTFRSVMYSSPFPLLSCAEFAKRCGVEQVTVRQWIRRGKLRTAVRAGRDWRIPSTAKRPEEGFVPAVYHVISGVPKEAKLDYPFL